MSKDRTTKRMYPECGDKIQKQVIKPTIKTATTLVNPFFLKTHDSDDYEKLIKAGFSIECLANSYKANGFYAFMGSQSGELSACIEMIKRLGLTATSCHMRTNINKNIYIVS